MLIVDTSVALKWYVEEPGSDRAAELIGSLLGAPDLILAEVANGLWKKARNKEIKPDQARAAMPELRATVRLLVPSSTLVERALQLALDLTHPVYDCFFLALAERMEAPVITADKRLIAACRGTEFEAWLRLL